MRSNIKQFLIYGAGSIAQSALGVILLPFYLRFFDPAQYGIISLLQVTVSFITLFANMGITSGLEMLYYEAEIGERKKLVGTTWLWYLIGGVASGAVLVIGASNISALLFHTVDYTYAIQLLGGYIFVTLLHNVPLQVLRMEKKAAQYMGLSLTKFALDFGLKLYFIVSLGRGIDGYFESGVISSAVILCAALPFVLKYVNLSLKTSYLKRLLVLGYPFIFSTFSVWALNYSDRFILNYYTGETAVGIYSLAYTFANLFHIFLYTPFGLFWSPFFLSYASEKSVEKTKMLLSRAVRYLFIISSALWLAISLGSGSVMIIFRDSFGAQEGYLQAENLVPLLTLGIWFYFIAGRFGNALFVTKTPRYFGIAGVIAAITNIVLNFLFIPKLGALGAAFTTAIAYFVHLALIYYWSQKVYPVGYQMKNLIKGCFFLLVAFIVSWQIRISNPWITLFTRVISGVLIFTLLCWFVSGIFTKEEKNGILIFITTKVKKLPDLLMHRS